VSWSDVITLVPIATDSPKICRYDAIVFDFDGVLVESVDLKASVFAELFRSYGDAVVALVLEYHRANGGISRFDKFRHFFREFIRQPLSPAQEVDLDRQFSALVEERVVAAVNVPGSEDFVRRWCDRLPLFIASGTPEQELRRIVGRRGMSSKFKGVFGSPRRKGEILSHIIKLHGLSPRRTLMVGDAIADLDGAREADTDFVGRVTSSSPDLFVGLGVPTLEDLNYLHAFICE
jgi:phosphoglycolate phosphatase-like HAD superfamily hydrolase